MRTFGELEAQIMQVVWRHDEPVTVRTVAAELIEGRPLAYTTVMTVIERLREKGWLTRTKVGRSFQYTAAREAQDYTADLMDQVLNSATDRADALLRFAGKLSPEEAAALRRALNSPADDAPSSGRG
ncbi:MAG: BlaI/MecI/CopY family transcriptional regulator [Sporichthyaceae bacterium]